MEQVGTVTELQYPQIRLRIMRALADLSDERNHSNEWFEDIDESGRGLGEVVHMLFDDSTVATDPEGYIGVALYDIEEARAIEDVVRALLEVGTHPTAVARDSPHWPVAVLRARWALQTMAFSG